MVDSYLSTKLICLAVSEKTHFTDDGWMDGRPCHNITSANIIKQS